MTNLLRTKKLPHFGVIKSGYSLYWQKSLSVNLFHLSPIFCCSRKLVAAGFKNSVDQNDPYSTKELVLIGAYLYET